MHFEGILIVFTRSNDIVLRKRERERERMLTPRKRTLELQIRFVPQLLIEKYECAACIGGNNSAGRWNFTFSLV